LGLDVGSISTNLVALDEAQNVIHSSYLLTAARPVEAVQEAVADLCRAIPSCLVGAAGTTGSGRELAAQVLGADVVKNEITSHAVAALSVRPDVRCVFEIGGQDSKIIILHNGVITDFAMNTVCAAGTGSFLDRQAQRLGIDIKDLGRLALASRNPVRIAGRCAVFAESDMIHKQQMGCGVEDIVRGLCEALVRNYLNNVAKGKAIQQPVLFQGGVAANEGIRRAFEEALGYPVIVPEQHKVMGALGAAIIASRLRIAESRFRGFGLSERHFESRGFECSGCANACEVVELLMEQSVVARWGGRCGRWERSDAAGA